MATYYVWSGATGTNAGTSWTNAYTAFGSAVTAATAAGDVILVQYTHQETLASATTYSFANNVNVISVDKDTSDAPTPQGTGGYIGNSINSISITGARKLYIYGITFRCTTNGAINTAQAASDGLCYEYESCYFWGSTTQYSILVSETTTTINKYVRFLNCTFRFGQTGSGIMCGIARVVFEGCAIASAGSAPTTLFFPTATYMLLSADYTFVGCDLSHCTGTLVGSMDRASAVFRFMQCKLGSGVTPLATQTPANKSSGVVYLNDCSSGDTHTFMGYYDAFGSCVSDSTIYYTSGAAGQSWKIVTTANCSFYTPFVAPFVDYYNIATTAVTPYFEILRDGSTTAYQNDQVWGEFFVKTTSGTTLSTWYSDRMSLTGTAANQDSGAGTGFWTGEAASAWSGKVDTGASVTPAEVGAIRGRVVVGAASTTVYVDPQIRT